MAASKIVREGNVLVFRMPVARLLRLTRAEGSRRAYDIVAAGRYVDDMMASLNRVSGDGMTEIENMLVGEIEHVHTAGFESVRRFSYEAQAA